LFRADGNRRALRDIRYEQKEMSELYQYESAGIALAAFPVFFSTASVTERFELLCVRRHNNYFQKEVAQRGMGRDCVGFIDGQIAAEQNECVVENS